MITYWIHSEEHTDIYTEGYVGITKHTAERRRREHGDRFPEDWIVEVVFEGSFKECLEKENQYRPEPMIGENVAPGGKAHGWRAPGVNTPLKFRTKEHNAKIAKSKLGIKHTEETKKKQAEIAKRTSKGMAWYNNGEINKRSKNGPPEGFVRGRLC